MPRQPHSRRNTSLKEQIPFCSTYTILLDRNVHRQKAVIMLHINNGNRNVQPRGSFSMPIRSSATDGGHIAMSSPVPDDQVRESILHDIEQAKEDLLRFRSEMDGLAKQLDGMTTDLEAHKDRVSEIDHDLTTTQEENVDLQVVLENAVKMQRESDGRTTYVIRRMHSNLANVVFESRQLQDRIASLAQHQVKHQGHVEDVGEKMREYVQMLEQAQGTLRKVLQTSRMPRLAGKPRDEIMLPSNLIPRRGSTTSIASTQSSNSTISSLSQPPRPASIAVSALTPSAGSPDAFSAVAPAPSDHLYRHRIIRRPSLPVTNAGANSVMIKTPSAASNKPKSSQSPQEGLRILLQNNQSGLGLSSLADQNK
ncbi:hypothetical protein BX666DRAFT_1896540 [Dichotomocladium elegans]|nr:hypothetical protein BX666DRAFT_1896540 [Dichotomocladium elegans]